MLSRYEFPSKEELDQWERLNTAKIAAYDFWDKAIENALPFIVVVVIITALVSIS